MEGLAGGVAFIGSPQGRDQLYLAELAMRANLGVNIGPNPSEQQIMEAVNKVHERLDYYSANSKRIYEKQRIGAEKKLEKLVDSLIREGKTVTYEEERQKMWNLTQCYLFSLLYVAVLLSPLFLALYLVTKTIKLILKAPSQPQKPKTS